MPPGLLAARSARKSSYRRFNLVEMWNDKILGQEEKTKRGSSRLPPSMTDGLLRRWQE
jgi:hypothetical protein